MNETLEKVTALPAWFRETKLGREMIADAEAEVAAERQRLISEMAELEAQTSEQFAKTDMPFSKAEADVKKAETALRMALNRLEDVRTQRRAITHGADVKRSALERRLHETAPISVMIEIRKQWEQERENLSGQLSSHMKDGGFFERRKPFSNWPSIKARATGFTEAIYALNALELTCASIDELKAAAAELYASIPPIGEPVEVDEQGEPVPE